MLSGFPGRNDEAIAAYQTAIRYRPDFADAWVNLGTALRKVNRLEQSAQALTRAVQLRPHLPRHISISARCWSI